MNKVGRRHREKAVLALYPGTHPDAPIWRYVETGETDGLGPVVRRAAQVAQALADEEPSWTPITAAGYEDPPEALRGPFDRNGVCETPCWVYVPGFGMVVDTFRLYQPLGLGKPVGHFSGWSKHPTHFIALPKPEAP